MKQVVAQGLSEFLTRLLGTALVAATCCTLAGCSSPSSERTGKSKMRLDPNTFEVWLRDEGASEGNIVKPRLYVRNKGTDSLSNFTLQYYFTVDGGKTPILEDWYTPDSSAGLEQVDPTTFRLSYQFTGVTLAPGATAPNDSGNVVGLHYADWSSWNKSDDWSYQGVSASFAQTTRVVLLDQNGNVVRGTGPGGAGSGASGGAGGSAGSGSTGSGSSTAPPVTRRLRVDVPPATRLQSFALVGNGSVDLRDGVSLDGAVANLGNVWTHVGNDATVRDLYSRPDIRIGDRSTVNGVVRTAGNAFVPNPNLVSGGIAPAVFDPPVSYSFSVSYPDAPGPDVTLERDELRTLAPGRYGRARLQPGAHLKLSSGSYLFDAFDAIEPESSFDLDESAGPVELFVRTAFNFRGAVSSTREPPALLLGVLEGGTVRLESAFHGTIVAPNADVVLATVHQGQHQGAFYGQNIVLDAHGSVAQKASPVLRCKPAGFRVPVSGTCSGQALSIRSHSGVTRAIWQGEELPDTGKRVQPREDFVFEFSEPVALDRVAGAVHVRSVACASPALPAGCTHDLALDFSYVGTDHSRVRIDNPNDSFIAGCKYQLTIEASPLTASADACLAQPARLEFRSLAERDGSALEYETKSIRFDPRNRKVAALAFEDTISWQADEFFEERSGALGLSAASDGLHAASSAATPGPGMNEETLLYRQLSAAVPVDAHGYRVHRSTQSGRVSSLTGHIAVGLPAPQPAALTEAQALVRAKTELPGIVSRAAAAKLLLLPPPTRAASEFRLVYRFALKAASGVLLRTVDVDALNGAILTSAPGSVSAPDMSCTSVDVTQLAQPDPLSNVMPLTIETLQKTKGFVDPTTLFVTEYHETATGPRVFTLDSRGEVGSATGTPLGMPSLFTQCPGQTFPNVVRLPGDVFSGPGWSIPSQVGVQFQLAMEGCIHYFSSRPRGFRPGGVQWSGWDGSGMIPIDIRMGPAGTAGALYTPRDADEGVTGFVSLAPEFPDGASFEVACHEFSHGVWDWLDLSAPSNESRTLNEAVADAFAAGAEYAARHDEASLWCIRGDALANSNCGERIDNPRLSGNEIQPVAYEGDNWCEACSGIDDVHINSGVFHLWFARLLKGATGSTAESCAFQVTPVSSVSLQDGLDVLNEIIFHALKDEYPPGGGYKDLANATISAAKTLYGDGPIAQAIVDAWHSVNVWEDFYEGSDPKLLPARNATKVSPWLDFRWTLPTADTQSDLQIDFVPTFNSTANTAAISRTVTLAADDHDPDDPTTPVAKLSIALEANSTYYWRVRPHSNSAWGDCYAVHSFHTGDTPAVTGIGAPQNLEDGHTSGTLLASPFTVAGAKGYQYYLGKTDPQCTPGPQVREASGGSGRFLGLSPSTSYVLNVQAVGPLDADGDTALSNCFSIAFTTFPLEAPTLRFPGNDDVFNYFPPHAGLSSRPTELSLQWQVPDGPDGYRLDFFEMDESGTCSAQPSTSRELDIPCEDPFPGCLVRVDVAQFDLQNPPGYCWRVTSLADGGQESEPSPQGRFHYGLAGGETRSPGVTLSLSDQREPGAIPGSSYGQPVTFNWDPMPAGVLYRLRIGPYPWPSTSTFVPPNCYGGVLGSYCQSAPSVATVDTLVAAPGVTFTDADAAQGRYCWAITPVLEAPNAPGQPAPRQPLTSNRISCYTTGPSEPEIVIDTPEPRYAGVPIHGHILLGFVPDNQVKLFPSHLDDFSFDFSQCQVSAGRFADIHDCRIDFTMPFPMAQGGPTESPVTIQYSLGVKAWNVAERSDTAPPAVDQADPVFDTTQDIPLVICGAADGQDCCPNDLAIYKSCTRNQKLTCSNGKCRACGDFTNQLCCHPDGGGPGGCHGGGCDPKTDTCQRCGEEGQICCNNAQEPGPLCQGNLGCNTTTNRCTQCGDPGEPCCANGNPCLGDLFCNNQNRCTVCGGAGETCCAGSCDPGLTCTNNTCGCASTERLAAPFFTNPVGAINFNNLILAGGTTCTPTSTSFSDPQDQTFSVKLWECTSGEYNSAVANGTIPTLPNSSNAGFFIGWSSVAGAHHYRVFLSQLDGAQWLINTKNEVAGISGDDIKTATGVTLARGTYFFTVRAVDSCGRIGLNSVAGGAFWAPPFGP